MASSEGIISVCWAGVAEKIPRNNLSRSASGISIETEFKGVRVRALKTVKNMAGRNREVLEKNVMAFYLSI